MKNSTLAMGAAVTALVVTAGIAYTTNAFTPPSAGRSHWNKTEQNQTFQQHMDQMNQIIENKDYDAWAALMAQHPNFDQSLITPENFDKFLHAHELMQEAHAILEELGLNPQMRPGHRGNRMGFGRNGFAEMQQIIENKDFEAWKALMEKRPQIDESLLTEQNFEKFIQAHDLMQSGDKDGARQLMEELGFGPGK